MMTILFSLLRCEIQKESIRSRTWAPGKVRKKSASYPYQLLAHGLDARAREATAEVLRRRESVDCEGDDFGYSVKLRLRCKVR